MDFDLILILGGSSFVYVMKSNCLRIDLWGNPCSVCWFDKKNCAQMIFFHPFVFCMQGSVRTSFHLFLECLKNVIYLAGIPGIHSEKSWPNHRKFFKLLLPLLLSLPPLYVWLI